jgi:hypothetical protein
MPFTGRSVEVTPAPLQQVSPPPGQLRLGELMVMVVAIAGAALFVKVGVRTWRSPGVGGEVIDHVQRAGEFAAGVLGIGLSGWLLIGALRRARSSGRVAWMTRAGWILWRLAIAFQIGLLLLEQLRAWRIDADYLAQGLSPDQAGFIPARIAALSVAVPMTLLGAMLALVPPGPPPRPRPHRARRAVGAGVLMTAVGVVIGSGLMLFPYLHLIAVEAVQNYLPLRMYPRWPTSTDFPGRFDRALTPCLLGLMAISTTAGWLLHDFRRPYGGERPSGVGWALRGLSLLATLGLAWWLLERTLPGLQPLFTTGLRRSIGGEEAAIVAAAFAALAVGLAARAVGGSRGEPLADERRLRLAVGPLASVLIAAGSILGILWAIEKLRLFFRPEDGSFAWPGLWLPGPAAELLTEAMRRVGLAPGFWEELFLSPNILLGLLVVVWCLVSALAAPFRRNRDQPAPLDVILEDVAATRRWAWLTFATTLTCLAALVILGMAGLVVFHYALRSL